jgi:enoyl-CoA hydratase/carnithine racemase
MSAADTRTGFEHITVGRDGTTGRLTLNRPTRRNALSLALMQEAIAALQELSADPECRVIVIAGNGPAFSAGHDLSEMRGRERAFYDELFTVCTQLMQTIHHVPQPVIARVHGIATAAGCQLVATCDLAIAAEEATFATPGVKIGLFCSTPMVAVSRSVGRKRAMEMLLTGTPIDARTALDWGLVNRVVPAADLDAAVDELAARVTASSAYTLAVGKAAFWEQIDRTEPGAYELTQQVMAANAAATDAQEGIGAFLDKRHPTWTHGE